MREKSAHSTQGDSYLYLWDTRPPCLRLHYVGRHTSRQSKPTLQTFTCVCVCVCVRACVRAWVCVSQWQARQATPAILQVSSSKQNAKKITTRVTGPFYQSITAILTEEKREQKQFTKPTHVAVYLFRNLDQDSSRLYGWQRVPGPVQRRKKGSKRENDADCWILEMTAKNVKHFKIHATTSAHWVIPVRTQEDKQKEKILATPTRSLTCVQHMCTLTHMTVGTHAYLHSSHASWKKKKKRKKNLSSCTTLKKKKEKEKNSM